MDNLTFNDAELIRDIWESNPPRGAHRLPAPDGYITKQEIAAKFDVSVSRVQSILDYHALALPPAVHDMLYGATARAYEGPRREGMDSRGLATWDDDTATRGLPEYRIDLPNNDRSGGE